MDKFIFTEEKIGESDTQERIELVNRYINLFGNETIKSLVSDRKFVHGDWIGFLNREGINYHIRIS